VSRRRLKETAIAFVFACASASAADPRGSSTQAPAAADPQLTLIVDRNGIRAGDTTVLSVVAPVGFLVEEPQAYFSSFLQWKPRQHTEPSQLWQYEITPRQPGHYSIFVRARVSAPMKGMAGQIIGRNVLLEVSAKDPNVLTRNSGLIVGALLGLISSFAGVYFKDYMDRWSARRNRFQWLTNELVGRLETARQDVRNGRSVNYQVWMEELYSKHYSALRQISTVPADGEMVGRQIVEIEGLLRQYNESLTRVSRDERITQDIERRIEGIQQVLSRHQG
jgi:hypothetical protein